MVPSTIQQDHGILTPCWSLSIKGICQVMEVKMHDAGIGVDLGEGNVGVPGGIKS